MSGGANAVVLLIASHAGQSWWQRNTDSIVAGVVSSFIVLALQFAVIASSRFFADAVGHRILARSLWRLHKPERVFVVTGSVHTDAIPEGTAFLAAPDAEAAGAARFSLGLLFPGADVVQIAAPEFSRDFYAWDVITVGGPVNNRCTREFLSKKRFGVYFDGFQLISPTGASYECDDPEPNSPGVIDYGLIVCAPNPFSPQRKWIVIAGCDTGGVLAAATVLTPTRPGRACARKIRRSHTAKSRTGYYAIIRSLTVGNIAGQPELVEVGALKPLPHDAVPAVGESSGGSI